MLRRLKVRSGLASSSRMTAAATVRDTSVGIATPATSIWKPKMRTASPVTLMMFIRTETLKVTRDLLMALKTAVPPLYRAMEGIEAMTIR